MKFPAIPIENRFWNRVDKSGDCWLWAGGKFNTGYGAVRVNGKQDGAHRVSWRLTFGPIPDGLFVCHSCDTKACVRPDHLYLGTNLENSRDAAEHGLYPSGERNPNARLTAAAIREIRESSVPASKIAVRFGVDPAHIRLIRRGGAWRNVA